jgi:rubrerythrin
MSFVQLVQEYLTDRPRGPGEQSEARPQVSTQLYRCGACDTTYISEEMETCPRCDGPVETTPTGRDLRYVDP